MAKPDRKLKIRELEAARQSRSLGSEHGTGRLSKIAARRFTSCPTTLGLLKNPRLYQVPCAVLLSEAKDLLLMHTDNSRCFATLSMTVQEKYGFSTNPLRWVSATSGIVRVTKQYDRRKR